MGSCIPSYGPGGVVSLTLSRTETTEYSSQSRYKRTYVSEISRRVKPHSISTSLHRSCVNSNLLVVCSSISSCTPVALRRLDAKRST